MEHGEVVERGTAPGIDPAPFRSLDELLDRLCEAPQASDGDRVSIVDALDVVGVRSFGTVLLLSGLVILMPLVGDIPGVPTAMAILVALASVQLLVGRSHFWLPGWLLRRSVEPAKLEKAVGWLGRPARFVDRLTRPRLRMLVRGPGRYLVAIASLLIASATPAMELVPVSADGGGAALAAFGLALVLGGGLLAAIALFLSPGTIGAVGWTLLGSG